MKFLVASLLIFSSLAIAGEMDISTRSALISKLESALSLTDAGTPQESRIMTRLADHYSERSRQQDMATKGNGSAQSRKDRKRAISLYQKLGKRSGVEEKGRILLQLAQLHELQGAEKKALAIYRRILKENYNAEYTAHAQMGIGEYYFRKGKYGKALKHFNKAAKHFSSNAQIKLRRAWCYYYLGQPARGVTILAALMNNPQGLSPQMLDQASRDWATLMAQKGVTEKDVRNLYRLSPEVSKAENLNFLAQELTRLGKKRQALMAVAVLNENKKAIEKSDLTEADKIAQRFQNANIQYDLGKQKLAVDEYQGAFAYWDEEGCEPAGECEKVRQVARKFLTDWGKATQRKPDVELIRAYKIYVAKFNEIPINFWAAEAARKLGMWRTSIEFYRNVSRFAGRVKGKKSGRDQTMVNGAFLGEIEVAELARDPQLKMEAYTHYLSAHPKGKKSLEVRYQVARLHYEGKNYDKAAEAFKKIALTKGRSQRSLKIKAADLALDSMVLVKDKDRLENWALKFAKVFRNKAAEYSTIARKSVMTRVVPVIDASKRGQKVSRSDLKKSLRRLDKVTFKGISREEKIEHYKARILLGEKLQELGEVERSSKKLLRLRGVKSKDKEFASSRLAWVAEMKLQFGKAYRLTKKLKMVKLSTAQKQLRLGTLAELGGLNPKAHYDAYLRRAKAGKTAASVAARLVRRSRKPMRAFRKYASHIKRGDHQLFGQITLEIFAKTNDYNFLSRQLRKNRYILAKSAYGRALDRFAFVKEFKAEVKKTSKQRLRTRSNRSLDRSLKKFIAQLRRLQSKTNKAVNSGDWTKQVYALGKMAHQYDRLGWQIWGLKAPRGLRRAQRKQYRAAIKAQAQPYFDKAKAIRQQLETLWASGNNFELLAQDFEKSRWPVRSTLARELRLLKSVAPKGEKRRLARILKTRGLPRLKRQITKATSVVRRDPFSLSKLKSLRTLGDRAGREILVAYIDARIEKLERTL